MSTCSARTVGRGEMSSGDTRLRIMDRWISTPCARIVNPLGHLVRVSTSVITALLVVMVHGPVYAARTTNGGTPVLAGHHAGSMDAGGGGVPVGDGDGGVVVVGGIVVGGAVVVGGGVVGG